MTPANGQEAAARAQFVREDLADNPAAAAEMLRDAYRRKDQVAAHLLMRYAPKLIADDRRAASEFGRVAGELYSPDPAKIAALRDSSNRMIELGNRLPITRAKRADLAQRFGLKSPA